MCDTGRGRTNDPFLQNYRDLCDVNKALLPLDSFLVIPMHLTIIDTPFLVDTWSMQYANTIDVSEIVAGDGVGTMTLECCAPLAVSSAAVSTFLSILPTLQLACAFTTLNDGLQQGSTDQ